MGAARPSVDARHAERDREPVRLEALSDEKGRECRLREELRQPAGAASLELRARLQVPPNIARLDQRSTRWADSKLSEPPRSAYQNGPSCSTANSASVVGIRRRAVTESVTPSMTALNDCGLRDFAPCSSSSSRPTGSVLARPSSAEPP